MRAAFVSVNGKSLLFCGLQMLIDACGPDVPELPEWCPKLYEEAGESRHSQDVLTFDSCCGTASQRCCCCYSSSVA